MNARPTPPPKERSARLYDSQNETFLALQSLSLALVAASSAARNSRRQLISGADNGDATATARRNRPACPLFEVRQVSIIVRSRHSQTTPSTVDDSGSWIATDAHFRRARSFGRTSSFVPEFAHAAQLAATRARQPCRPQSRAAPSCSPSCRRPSHRAVPVIRQRSSASRAHDDDDDGRRSLLSRHTRLLSWMTHGIKIWGAAGFSLLLSISTRHERMRRWQGPSCVKTSLRGQDPSVGLTRAAKDLDVGRPNFQRRESERGARSRRGDEGIGSRHKRGNKESLHCEKARVEDRQISMQFLASREPSPPGHPGNPPLRVRNPSSALLRRHLTCKLNYRHTQPSR